MKKLILITIAVLLFQLVQAKQGKGKMFIGGGVGASSGGSSWTEINENQSVKEFNISLAPQFGYFINDKIALGVFLNYGYSKYTSTELQNMSLYNTSNKSRNTTYGAGLFVRYYKPIADKFYFTLHTNIGYNYSLAKTKTEYINYASGTPQIASNAYLVKSNTYSLAISPGFEYFITPHVGLRTSFGVLGYTNTPYKNDVSFKRNTNEINFNFNQSTLTFGMNYFF